MVIDLRGPYRTYNSAVQGVDFIDLGIPDPEILDLFLEQRVYERYMEEYEAEEAAKQEQEAVAAAE